MDWFDEAKFKETLNDKRFRYVTSPLPTCLIELEVGTLRVTQVNSNYNVVYSYLGRVIERNSLEYLQAIDTCCLISKVINIVLNI